MSTQETNAKSHLNDIFGYIEKVSYNEENVSDIEDTMVEMTEYLDKIFTSIEELSSDKFDGLHDSLKALIGEISEFSRNKKFNEYEKNSSDYGCDEYHNKKNEA